MSWDEKAFKEKLENTHTFPGSYSFKFIVTPQHQKEVEALVNNADIKLRPSSGNKYISITLSKEMETSQAVIDVYNKAHTIEGIIAL